LKMPKGLCAEARKRRGHTHLAINMKIRDIPQSGKVGTMVSYKTRYGQVRRRYVIPRDPATLAQMNRRVAMTRWARQWSRLTEEQRHGWNATAGDARTRPRLNQSGRLSGFLLFVRINCNLAKHNLPPVDVPPAVPRLGRNPVAQLIITNTKGTISIKLSVSAKPAQYIVVLGTKPLSAGASYADHFSILGLMSDPIRGMSDITDLFVGKFGVPEVGSRVFIRTRQHINGWEDIPEQISAIVPAA
jgi:hypothetical protein